jgi:hypothetical protein
VAATLRFSERARVAYFIPRHIHILRFRLHYFDGINEMGKVNEHTKFDRIKLNTDP